jgi:hypothetical protein
MARADAKPARARERELGSSENEFFIVGSFFTGVYSEQTTAEDSLHYSERH